ncbi:MAG: hypothetical protein D6755_03200 [Anaerolineae bacterium]|nr:MAG: hypothetical protein D6755_03200 [Anaerolineae bacterium]
MDDKKARAFRIGITVMLILAVLTIGEFYLGRAGAQWTAVFLAIALIKASLVVRDYMHIGRLFGEEEH